MRLPACHGQYSMLPVSRHSSLKPVRTGKTQNQEFYLNPDRSCHFSSDVYIFR